MSEETTQNIPDGRSFEERVFARFDAIDARFNVMGECFVALEEKVDRRLLETRPIWEQVLARLDKLEVEMREGFEKSHSEIRRLDRKIDILNKNILDVRTDQQELEERVDKLDSQPT